MRRVIAYSFVVEAVVSVVLIATFKLASDLWGAEGFGAWTLARRIIAFALPLTTIGIEVALPRYIAYHHEQSAAGYLAAGSLVMLAGVTVTSALLLAAPRFFTEVLFGDASLRHFLVPLWGLLLAYSVHILYFAYLRGCLRILEANLLHLWAFGIAPLIAFSYASQSPERAMSANAALVFVPPALLLAFTILRSRPVPSHATALARRLAAYGTSRMLSALGLTTLALIPPLIAAQQGGLARAGAVGLGITLIGFAGTLMAPIALILLPAVARQSGKGDVVALRKSFHRVVAVGVPAMFVAFAAIWIAAPLLGQLFLAQQAELATQVLRVAGIGAGSYALFSLLRPMLDAVTEKARVLQSTFVAGAVFGTVWSGGLAWQLAQHPLLPMIAYSAAIVALALCACLFARLQIPAREKPASRDLPVG